MHKNKPTLNDHMKVLISLVGKSKFQLLDQYARWFILIGNIDMPNVVPAIFNIRICLGSVEAYFFVLRYFNKG